MIKLVIIDYGIWNITSIVNILNNFKNVNIELSKNPKRISECDKLILPGVGAFGNAMKNINEFNLIEPINDYVRKGNSLLGICLGMQLLLDMSEEFGSHKGLGLIPGVVKKISHNKDIILPNVGFHKPIQLSKNKNSYGENEWFYFVHSFKCIPKIKENISSVIQYEGIDIVSGLKKENIRGCQFHPEKSQDAGINYFKNFLDE